MIATKKALRIALADIRPLKAVHDSLDEVLDCRLAEGIRADRDLPPTGRSAMAGYAVRAKNLAESPRELRPVGERS